VTCEQWCEIMYEHSIGLVSSMLVSILVLRQLIGFCSDGASAMTGAFSGVATLLKQKYPNVIAFHCMAHRLELAVKDAVDEVNFISHFRIFIDSVYKVYSMSPKNQRQLETVASELATELLKVRKVFDIRWVFSSHSSMSAVWQDLPALYKHFVDCSHDMSRLAKDRSKFEGLAKKIQSWFFLAEVAMLKDALFVLMQLSMYFQSNKASVTTAKLHIDGTLQKLVALKEYPGETLNEFLTSFSQDGKCRGVPVLKCANDDEKFRRTRTQFYQAVHDNIVSRFPCTELLHDALVLSELTWPSDEIELALYGDREIVSLCKRLYRDSESTVHILSDFMIYKRTKRLGPQINKLLKEVETYPISTAACERGFSQMKLAHSRTRNRLIAETVSSLLMISINGPGATKFNARKYVILWLQKGRHSACDKPTGKTLKESAVNKAASIFL
jgi:hAT family C-terminal dimerisation region